METKVNNMNIFERELGHLPPLPPRLIIAFRCRDCECMWTFGIENPISFKKFHDMNKQCLSCGKLDIEIDIIPIQPTPLSEE